MFKWTWNLNPQSVTKILGLTGLRHVVNLTNKISISAPDFALDSCPLSANYSKF
jgi:hypothetical protein